ncbi:MAG: hypothetical protein LH632_11355 [Rhodoferax sp.]|nr:hypothetical protein [Rhodoferax sp.]
MSEALHQASSNGSPRADQIAEREPGLSELELLRLALNQIDYGLVAVDVDSGAIAFANALGMAALHGQSDQAKHRPSNSGLGLFHGCLSTSPPARAALLNTLLQRTKSGLRGILNLGLGARITSVAVVPLSAPAAPDTNQQRQDRQATAQRCYALLVFAKEQVCDHSSMAIFSRECGLTHAESQVLAKVCRGLRPIEIASHHGVQISTVRTQLRSIRVKTSSETIGAVVQQVSALPPITLQVAGAHVA